MSEAFQKVQGDDAEPLATLYRRAVTELGIEHYNQDQVAVWASFADDIDAFRNALLRGYSLCLRDGDAYQGFGTLYPRHHIYLLYTAPEYVGRGVASRILQALEGQARANGAPQLTTDASLSSRALFERAGYRLVTPDYAERKGLAFLRFAMEKAL